MSIVVFEGMDAAGKTTLAKYLASIDGFYIKSPASIRFLKARECFDDIFVKNSCLRNDVLERFFYYVAVSLHTAWMIETMLLKHDKIVVDRYYYSTVVYHEMLLPNITRPYKYIFEHLPRPDLVFYIYTSYDILKKRLLDRNNVVLNDLILSRTTFTKLDGLYRSYLPPNTIIINNSSSLRRIKTKLLEEYESFFENR